MEVGGRPHTPAASPQDKQPWVHKGQETGPAPTTGLDAVEETYLVPVGNRTPIPWASSR
jgi:hypothetical protein